ncbi:MAG: molybdopterin molybdotransferase MoeA [Rhodovibrionaceae bacterium]|nr:molybdopterin molybdotransferase MoeA [Rhodovibrionaceae bacterium]
MISVEEAHRRILSAFQTLPAETVSIDDALGRVLAEDVLARSDQPPKAVSAMDGYAVRAADASEAPTRLEIVGEIAAGQGFEGQIGPGQAARIYTGAPLPEGADAIVMQENAERSGNSVEIREAVTAGRFVRPAGLDFKAGQKGLGAGRILTARDVGLAAAMDHSWLRVTRRPRVAVLSTGDELVLPGEPRGPQDIVSSNSFALSAFVKACGGTPVNLGIARDSRDELAAALRAARGTDLILTSGGASVGAHDLVQDVLEDLGLELDFWKIAMRPGKPLIFGRLADTPVIGLPGNPVSGLVCSMLYLRPAMARMLGRADFTERSEKAVLGTDLGENDERQDYLRGRLRLDDEGRRIATPFERQDSAMLFTLAQADCLVVRAPHAPAAKAGEEVEIIPLGPELIAI